MRYNGKLEIHNSLLNVVLYDKPEIRTISEQQVRITGPPKLPKPVRAEKEAKLIAGSVQRRAGRGRNPKKVRSPYG